MPNKGDSYITIPTYKKYRIEDKLDGHDIIIISETGTITIQCRWPKQKQDKRGHEDQ